MVRKSHAQHKKDLSDKLGKGLFDLFKKSAKSDRKHKSQWSDGGFKKGPTLEQFLKKAHRKPGYQFGDITKAAFKKMKNLFKKADVDKDGKVTQEELDAFKPL